jgi:hypothetical protein
MSAVTRLDKPMTKHDLILHIVANHNEAVGFTKNELKAWPKSELLKWHGWVHLGLGR